MTIRFQCPSCGAAKQAKDELAGRMGKCKCGATFEIPGPEIEDLGAFSVEPTAELAPEENNSSFSAFDMGAPASANDMFADLGELGAPAAPQPYGNYAPYAQPTQPVPNAAGHGRQSPPNQNPSPATPQSKEDRLLVEHSSGRSAIEYLIQDTRPPIEAWRVGLIISFVALGFTLFALSAWTRSLLLYRAAIFMVVTGASFGMYHYNAWQGLVTRPIPKEDRLYWGLEAFLTAAGIFGLGLAVMWGLYASLLDSIEVSKQNVEKLAEELNPKKNSPVPTPELSIEDLNKIANDSVQQLVVPAPPDAKVKPWKVLSQEWKPTLDPSTTTAAALEEFAKVSNALPGTVPASFDYRFALIGDDLLDLQNRTIKKLKGRRYRIARPVEGQEEEQLDVSTDGEYIVSRVSVSGTRNEPSKSGFVVRQFDGTVVDFFPNLQYAYFLPSNRIFLLESPSKFAVYDIATKQSKPLAFSGLFLGFSNNRKFVITGKLENEKEYLRRDTKESENTVLPVYKLNILDTETLAIQATTTYEGIRPASDCHFTHDGSHFMLDTGRTFYVISTNDGEIKYHFDYKQGQKISGWIGESNKLVGISQAEKGSSTPSALTILDIASDRFIANIPFGLTDNHLILFKNAYLAKSRFAATERGGWRRLPISDIESAPSTETQKDSKSLPKLAKLVLKNESTEVYFEIFKTLAIGVMEKQMGLQVIEASDDREHCKIEFDFARSGGVINVSINATGPDGSIIWSGSGQGKSTSTLAGGASEFVPAQMIYGIVTACNNISAKNPFPSDLTPPVPASSQGVSLSLAEVSDPNTYHWNGYPVSNSVVVDNSWYGSESLFKTSRTPFLEYEAAVPEDRPMGFRKMEILGVIEAETPAKILFVDPNLGLATLPLEKNAQPSKYGEYGELEHVVYIPGTKELVLSTGKVLSFNEIASTKKPRTLTVDDEIFGLIASQDGSKLAVQHRNKTAIYDLSNFRTRTRNAVPEKLEVPFSVSKNTTCFSNNGDWFAAIPSAEFAKAILVNCKEKQIAEIQVDKTCKGVDVTDNGTFSCYLENGNYFTWKAVDGSGNKVPVRQNMRDRSGAVLIDALSPSRNFLARLGPTGDIALVRFPSGELTEKLWDPGQERSDRIDTSIVSWSMSGDFVFWKQENRIVVWEFQAPAETAE